MDIDADAFEEDPDGLGHPILPPGTNSCQLKTISQSQTL